MNSSTRFGDIIDGSSNTIIAGERSDDTFDSTWMGVVDESMFAGWRVLGWTGEPPNHPGSSFVHFHAYAQFNSMHNHSKHNRMAYFSFADGSVRSSTDDIDQPDFKAMGTIKGRERIDYDF